MRNQQIDDEASEWFVRMRDGEDSSAVRGELMEWLRRSPEHVSAYLDIAAVWMEAGNVEIDATLDLATRVALAKADRGVAEFVPRAVQPATRYFNRNGLFAVAASVLFLMLGVTAWWKFAGDTYSTGLGEQRSIALRDGSTIELNSQSRVRVHLDDERRSIELLRGQALFNVAKDASRPFVVHADNTTVRAVGTVFDVYRKQTSAVVTVVEGSVVVERGKHAAAAARSLNEAVVDAGAQPASVNLWLTAGKQVVVSREAAAEPKPVNVNVATAWTRRELVFEFTPLADAAAEFNRYNERRLIVEGEQLRSFKISAIFRSTDPGSLVRYVQSMPDVQIDETENSIVIAPANHR